MSDPNHVTHVPVIEKLPEDNEFVLERPPLPTPSLYQEGVKVRHRKDPTRENVIRIVDWKTRQFRPAWDTFGRVAGRTVWESFDEWDPVVEPSQAEKARLEAADKLRAELDKLDATELAAVEVLVDEPDATKALAKLEAMRRLGIIGAKKGK